MRENAACHTKDELSDACEALKRAAPLFHAVDQLAETADYSAAMRELALLGFAQTANAAKEAEWLFRNMAPCSPEKPTPRLHELQKAKSPVMKTGLSN